MSDRPFTQEKMDAICAALAKVVPQPSQPMKRFKGTPLAHLPELPEGITPNMLINMK